MKNEYLGKENPTMKIKAERDFQPSAPLFCVMDFHPTHLY